MVQILCRFPLLNWIFICLSSHPKARPDLDDLSNLIEEIRTFNGNWLRSKITAEILEENGIDLQLFNKGLENEGAFYFFILDHFGYDVRSSRVNENEAFKISTAISQIDNLSLMQSKSQLTSISKGNFFM